jgi:predicted RNA-binding Zn-ribbon protein involved in translation (DUF1610 family)
MKRQCKHCGFKGPLEHKGDVTVYKQEEEVPQIGGVLEYDHNLGIFLCPACNEVSIVSYVWSVEVGEVVHEETLYPTTRDNSALPGRVRQRFDAAHKVRKIDPSFYAVGVRRMLETVANEKKAKGKDLFEKLDDLVSRDLIPAPLARAAHQLRRLGNLGAHDEEIELEEEDVPAIESLADAILEYLYRAPAKISAVEKSLKARKPTKKSG